MDKERMVLCGANSYIQKYYFNEAFNELPETVKQELKILCVTFTEEIGGTFTIEFEEDASIVLKAVKDEQDFLFDDIGSGLKIKQMEEEKAELFESLSVYYKTFYMGDIL